MMHIDPTMIHPELRRAASLIRFFWPSFTERKFHLAKVANEKLKGKCRSPIAYEQKTITRRDNSQLRLCIYSPLEPKADVPGLLWLHGGGYALGTPEQDELFIQRFIHASNCVVVSPDYRLSIDAPYPAALEDGYAALLWLKEHGPTYGVRTDQLMVCGDSAGGGLAVALTLFARDQKEVHMRVFDGCFHGFDIVCAKTGIAQVAKDFLMTHFLYATEHYYAAQPPE